MDTRTCGRHARGEIHSLTVIHFWASHFFHKKSRFCVQGRVGSGGKGRILWCVVLKKGVGSTMFHRIFSFLSASCFKVVKELSCVRNDRGEFTLRLLFPDGETSSLPHRGFGDVTSKVMEELSYFLLQNGQLEVVPVSLQN